MPEQQPAIATQYRVEETTIREIHEAMRGGTLSAADLVECYLRRIDAYDQAGPKINCIVNINENARERAAELDDAFARAGEFTGPLHGIPVLVKDCIETNDATTTFGNIAFAQYRPKSDATVVRKLREAGAIILAKTTLPDFATSWFGYSSMSGHTLNPYALDRDPGASSSGSGAATAANLATISLGTDCGGSIRVPSSFNNLVGIRSTPGLISRNGVACLIFFQDTIGPMTRTVSDAATVFDTLVGYDPADSLTAAYHVAQAPETYTAHLAADGLNGARLGLVTNALGSEDNEYAAPVNEVIRKAVTAIEKAGARILEVEIPDLPHHIGATLLYVNRTKFDINSFLGARPDAPVRSLSQLIESRRYDPACDLLEQCGFGPDRPEYDPMYYQRLAAREEFARATQNVLSGNELDGLIYPSVQVVPPLIRDCDEGMWPTLAFPTNTLIASQTWMPAISVPAGFTDQGLPVGLEITSYQYAEPKLFRLAYGFEQATHYRRASENTPELAP